MNEHQLGRLAEVIRFCVANLPEQDRAARIAYCRATGEHGVRVLRDAGDVEVRWGGQRLAVVPLDALDATGDLIAGQYIPVQVPDSPAAAAAFEALVTPLRQADPAALLRVREQLVDDLNGALDDAAATPAAALVRATRPLGREGQVALLGWIDRRLTDTPPDGGPPAAA
ncbi:hypothetical protein RB614_40355 [Phytohabitans sp. ZYX-F-186]|uniref:Uncharacterized protein n=1 Tax=Phytohabitans maris TaxID=3071409 RepID=A0ABU0ZXQ4_9ACTN|nr:hypothetical protein [Phytohabitans sp. ZYX-F-186]MDQ7910762.1 hypothetical protein [Phytohabitans sp. ZYX-F-186]